MNQLPLFGPPTWSVTELTRYLRELLEGDFQLQDLWVSGEVSNCSQPQSGHLYFTLKDSACSLKVVMWRNSVQRQAFIPRNGEAVEVHGAISLYEAGGQYQLYADLLRPAGEGRLFQEFLRLKALLEAEGLFAPERKRPVPQWPVRIGIVTSPTGAALRDMLNTLRRRYPIAEIILAPTPVQGDGAPEGILTALSLLSSRYRPDVILLARGGGSIEDLAAFNDEAVVRAIAACSCPIVCGVGHETDFTLADFAADLRAPTPTAAAELATPNRADLWIDLQDLNERLARATGRCLENQRWELSHLAQGLKLHSPLSVVRSGLQHVDVLGRRAAGALAHRQRLSQVRLAALEQRLNALNPLAVLQRGYAVVTGPDGKVLRSVSQAHPSEHLNIRVADGSFGVRVDQPTPGTDLSTSHDELRKTNER